MNRLLIVLLVVCLLPLSGVTTAAWAQVEEDAHSLYTPTVPPPAKGTDPYLGPVSTATQWVIGGVPEYFWWHGCGPTAAGIVIGYWERHGFPLLIPGDASTQTAAVDDAIATGGDNPGDIIANHYGDYSIPFDPPNPAPPAPDRSEPPAGDEHPSDCLADFMRTSWSAAGMKYGWSWSSDVDNSLEGYVNWANTAYSAHYVPTATYRTWGNFTWMDLRNALEAGRPCVFLVDTNGNGSTNHFVTVVGWQDDSGFNEYGCLDNANPGIRWERFRPVNNGDPWGVHSATFFSITSTNNPPVADAGPDQIVECVAAGEAPVTLDGTGSSDPDGDPITYAWSASGVTFDDPSSATPTGDFPLGTTTVTLTITDGDMEDTDTVDISVVDTTPPVIACPSGLTVECSDFCGTPKDDAQLTAFFAGVSATDACCAVTITNDAPDCFPLGMTMVAFTATDCAGNTAQCMADVTVEDTTPPELLVRLNRRVLWPPNHKMAHIRATVRVRDVCCETPTFVLFRVTSNEPDNGKGDGNTDNDIVIINKRNVLLRSERSGGGDGRLYRLVYRATDCSGNMTQVVRRVRVPHDHSGWTLASTGFESAGIGFEPGLDRFVLVLRSKPAEFGIDENGNEVLIADTFNATAIDVTEAYIGNLKDVILPEETLEIDNNADGMMDLALFYSAAAVNALIDESTPVEDGRIDANTDYGTIGFHYVSAEGVDYLSPNIFDLGLPVPLVPEIVIGRTADADGDEPEKRLEGTPAVTTLLSAYPNPFNPTTTIPFNLVTQNRVVLRIYNARGELIRTLKNEAMPAGPHQVVWDGLDTGGHQVATGVYFVRLHAGTYQATKKIVMLK